MFQTEMNTRRIDELEEEVKRLKGELKDVRGVQDTHDRLIHGLEKVTRGHNLRIFGLDKDWLFKENKIPENDYNSVFRFLCDKGLRIEPDTIDKMFQFVDVIHELPVGFIVSFTRRQDRQYIMQVKKNLRNWAPCATIGPK